MTDITLEQELKLDVTHKQIQKYQLEDKAPKTAACIQDALNLSHILPQK